MKPFYNSALALAIATSAILFGSGCKQGEIPPPIPVTEHHILGVWAGTATNATETIPYFLTLKPDGTCSFEGITAGSVENFGAGTYSVSNGTVTATLVTLYGVSTNIGVKQSVKGTFDSKAGTLTSLTWEDIAGATDHGTFKLEKLGADIQGVWVGTASNAAETIPYFLTLKADGTCSFEGITAGSVENFGTGTYSVSGTAFTGSLNTLYGVSTNIGVKQSIKGTFDSKAGTLTSLTWEDTFGATDNGTFILAKAN
ncbi:MAG: hypothetical protein V4577_04950 [Bacteroidota bacterium]